MVAPFVIAGLTTLGGMALGVVTDALVKISSKKYAVVFLFRRQVVGKIFQALPEAESYQERLSRMGQGSILIERDEAGDYKGLKSLRAMAAGGRRILPADLRRMKLSSSDELSADTPHNFDTVEEQLKVSQATTRRPTPAWAVRARKGPYPQTDPGHQEYMPEAPLFRDTTSSHEWKSDVDTWSVPDKFFPGHRGMPSQPDELVVTQALQYPETELVEEVKASPERAGARRSKNRRLQEQSDRSTEIVSEMEVETSPPAEER